MKRCCAVMAALVLALIRLIAYADGSDTSGAQNVPNEIRQFIADSPWADWEITGWVNPAGLLCEDACAFLAVKKGSENDLLAFGSTQGAWKFLWHNSAALPQVGEPILLWDTSDQNVRFSSYYVYDGEIEEAYCSWVRDENGTFALNRMYNYDPLMFVDASARNALHLYDTGWVAGEETDIWFCGAYTAELQSFDYNRFPKTAEDARAFWGDLTEVNLKTLSSEPAAFPPGEKYRVYAGPGVQYGQAGGGKATVSTNDAIFVYGTYEGWLLIGYMISDGRMRIGWIEAPAAPESAELEALAFPYIPARLLREADLTDDPLAAQTPVVSLPQGTDVLWLANLKDDRGKDFAYIRCDAGQPICGFVELDALCVQVQNGLPESDGPAQAETAKDAQPLMPGQLIPLSNSDLQDSLGRHGYRDWQFFQPAFAEHDGNSSSDAYLSALNTYPVIGVREGQVSLFVMKKRGGAWTPEIVNPDALHRAGLSLYQFTIEEKYEPSTFYDAYFSYIVDRKAQDELTLTLTLGDVGASYFSHIHTGSTDLHLNYDRGITAQFDFPFYGQYAFEVNPRQILPFGIDEFVFSDCPLSVFDLLEPAEIAFGQNAVPLYYFPDDTCSPVFFIGADEDIKAFFPGDGSKWMLTYCRNGFFFAHAGDVKPAAP